MKLIGRHSFYLQIGRWRIHIYRAQTNAERYMRWRNKMVKQHRCTVCGKRVQRISKYTGEPYRQCDKHRKRANLLRKISNKKEE